MSIELPPAAITELQTGNKIAAIKLTREASGMGLKEAKDLVEAYVADDPALQAQQPAVQLGARGSFLGWLVMMILVVATIVYFWPA